MTVLAGVHLWVPEGGFPEWLILLHRVGEGWGKGNTGVQGLGHPKLEMSPFSLAPEKKELCGSLYTLLTVGHDPPVGWEVQSTSSAQPSLNQMSVFPNIPFTCFSCFSSVRWGSHQGKPTCAQHEGHIEQVHLPWGLDYCYIIYRIPIEHLLCARDSPRSLLVWSLHSRYNLVGRERQIMNMIHIWYLNSKNKGRLVGSVG